ncbi:MAG TPA: hypothetical protein VHB27_01950 [Rhodopila sp.]|uniref:hypothetical protein n=1 Tax=Rhodopila sp. TaxID=2480087 RepID=UPI002CA66B6F|nr:hypothetical protein [Rhodopila sp.]HVY13962.1 hypothetical protein [Rhodopila sp.]
MRSLIGYFGLARLAGATAPVIETAIVAPLREAGFEILRAGHFNCPAALDNPRSGERGAIPDADPARLLSLDACEQEVQTDDAIAEAFATARAYPDAFGDGYRSLRNLCHQLRSLDRLWRLLAAFRPGPEDVVLLLRPDLLYLDPLVIGRDLGELLAGGIDLVVPAWQSWGGLNDRFAFATPHAARVYATRYRLIADGCTAMGGLHAERFLAFSAGLHGLRVARTPLRAARLRVNGDIAGNDLRMLDVQA